MRASEPFDIVANEQTNRMWCMYNSRHWMRLLGISTIRKSISLA